MLGVIHVSLSDKLEQRLRSHVQRRGDLSNIIEEALRKYLPELELKVERAAENRGRGRGRRET